MSQKAIQEEKVINGVNVSQMEETLQAVTQQPELAEFKFRANNQWQDGGHNKVKVDGYYGTCREIERKHALNLMPMNLQHFWEKTREQILLNTY